MTADVVVFDFEKSKVRTLTKDGEALFCASDVAKVLGFRDGPNLLRRLNKDDTQILSTLDLSGKTRGMAYINESGIFTAILRSTKPEAKRFQKWVTRDVLPALLRTGTYAMPGKTSDRTVEQRLDALERAVESLLRSVASLTESVAKINSTIRALPRPEVQERLFSEKDEQDLMWISSKEARKMFPVLDSVSQSNASLGWMMTEICRRFNFKVVESANGKQGRRYHRSAWEKLIKEKPWRYIPQTVKDN
jgi:prophage antirepressor-like protein